MEELQRKKGQASSVKQDIYMYDMSAIFLDFHDTVKYNILKIK